MRPRKYDRDRIRALVEQGLTTRQIADKVGAPLGTLRGILRSEGLVAVPPVAPRTGEPARRGPRRSIKMRAQRMDQVEKLRKAGMTQAEIAEALGISLPLVGHAVGSLQAVGRLPLDPRVEGTLGFTPDQRRAIIRFMREHQGLTFREIAEAWGLSQDHVAKSYREDPDRREG